MKEINFTTPIPPSVNHYLNYRVGGYGNKRFVSSYPAPETIKYTKETLKIVKEAMMDQGWESNDPDMFYDVHMTFYFDRKRKDSNNYLKVPFDVFTDAGLWIDDDKALPVVERVYIDRERPRIEFKIVEKEFKGIFDSNSEFINFLQNNCNSCKRNTEKCGILKKILGNEIVSEVTDNICNKNAKKTNL